MRKAISILLVLVLCLSLCACGSNTSEATEDNTTLSKEEMMNVATRKTAESVNEDIGGNKAKAKSYVGNLYIITGRVTEIEEDYCVVMAKASESNSIIHFDNSERFNAEFAFHVYLPLEELVEVELSTDISFVGMITDSNSEEYGIADRLYLVVSNAYLAN